MLLENDVVKYCIKYLKGEGYQILSSSDTSQHGYDIVAKKNNIIFYIEAKGQTSSKEHTNRYGKEFTPNQKWDHVSKAVYTVMKILNEKENCMVGIALPLDGTHVNLIEKILPSLQKLEIKILFVNEKGKVTNINK